MSLPADRLGSSGAEAVDLAGLAGLHLDDWQQWVLDHALAERLSAQGEVQWSAFEVAVIVPRQNGKGAILEARQLAGLVLLEEPLQVHSAHEYKTSYEHFLRMCRLVEACPDIDRKVLRIRRGAGEHAIEMRSGARLRFMARTGSSGRGFSGSTVYLDEAFALTSQMMGALLPTLSAVPNPQLWYMSSAPLSSSPVLHDVRKRGIAGEAERLLFAEWSVDEGVDPDDVEAWYTANPALGLRISEEFVQAERQALPDGEFVRERLGVPDPLPEDTTDRPVKVPASVWAASASHATVPVVPGELVLAVDASPEGEWASIAVGIGDLASPYVEVIEHRRMLGWVPDRLVELVLRHQPRAVGIDPGGPAGALLGPVLAALSQAGVSSDVVRLSSASDMKHACAGFFAALMEGRVRRPADGQGPLDVAVGDACERRVGDAWLWDRRRATVPISPLVAVTVAYSLLSPAEVEVPELW